MFHRLFGPARLALSFAVAILVLIVMWVAVRAVGPAEASRPPSVTLPSMPQVPVSPSSSSSPSPSLSPSLSPSPSPSSARPKRSPSARRSSSPSRTPSPSSSPAAPKVLEVSVSVPASWEQGYVAGGRVRNTGDKPVEWRVTVTHKGLADLRLAGTWNANGSQSGNRMTFSGGALAPGRTATFGWQITKSGEGRARPSGCSVVGGTCSMR